MWVFFIDVSAELNEFLDLVGVAGPFSGDVEAFDSAVFEERLDGIVVVVGPAAFNGAHQGCIAAIDVAGVSAGFGEDVNNVGVGDIDGLEVVGTIRD